jgi:hypothetical protein
MSRFVLTAFALAGLLAAAHPAFTDPVAATASDHVQAAPAREQAPIAAPAWSPPSDASVPASASFGKGITPVGFGWG